MTATPFVLLALTGAAAVMRAVVAGGNPGSLAGAALFAAVLGVGVALAGRTPAPAPSAAGVGPVAPGPHGGWAGVAARSGRPVWAWAATGTALLVAAPLVARLAGAPHWAGSGPFVWPGRGGANLAAWMGATAAVVVAEEAMLRGALWRALEARAGTPAALVVTSAAFAALHVPAYGLGALPLDLTVGVLLGGLRAATGGLAAPLAAHLAADWAGWWLA
ncbi:MAG TPA: CPBP family intramembrane glutamic endopeptidase [Acidimicrobiales bacterium]|nr:CPBP family intramembrane glutamic endopeptidase [Acidimicrobiales bacterium]